MKKIVSALLISSALIAGSAIAADGIDPKLESLRLIYEEKNLEQDMSTYSKVLIAPLGLTETIVVAPPWITGDAASPSKWQLTSEDEAWLRSSFQQAMRDQISEHFEVVTEHGDDVLLVRIDLVSLMPYSRKGEDVQVQGFGEVVAQARLRDGRTGKLLAIYEGAQQVGHTYQQNSRLNAENSLKGMFNTWGARIREYMRHHGSLQSK